MTTAQCGRLGCAATATAEVSTPYDAPVLRCAPHAAETAEVYGKFANRQSSGASIRPLSKRPRTTALSAPLPDCSVTLGWGIGSKQNHMNKRSAVCVHCGRRTILMNSSGEPAHKVCEETWVAAGMPERRGGRTRVH